MVIYLDALVLMLAMFLSRRYGIDVIGNLAFKVLLDKVAGDLHFVCVGRRLQKKP